MTVGAGPDPGTLRELYESWDKRGDELAAADLLDAAPWLLAQAEAAQRVRAIHYAPTEAEWFVSRVNPCDICADEDDLATRPLLRTESDGGKEYHVHHIPPIERTCAEDEQEWPCPTVAALDGEQ